LPEYEIVNSKSNDFSSQNLRPLSRRAQNEAMGFNNVDEYEYEAEECRLISSSILAFLSDEIACDLSLNLTDSLAIVIIL
jgi:hypothetical protein